MTGGVEEHAERRPGLVLGQGCTEFEHCPFAGVKVVDHDIDVHLLRDVLAGPLRRTELCDALETDALVTRRVANLAPTLIRAHLPIEQSAIERGEATRVVAVEDEGGKACDCHGWHRRTVCGRIPSGMLDFRAGFCTRCQAVALLI